MTTLLLAMARSTDLLRNAAFDLKRDDYWSEVTFSGLHPSEFNNELADPNQRLALQGNVHGHASDGREVEWELEVSVHSRD